jgi:hypothetical protein
VANGPVLYSVEAVRPESVREDLERVWAENLPLKTTASAKYEHLYRDAVDPAPNVLVLRARPKDTGEEKLVGTIGTCVRRFWFGGKEVRASVTADFAVDSAHRLLLPALQLARAARDQVRENFEVGYGYPNRHAVGVMMRAGFSQLGQTSRLVHVLRPGAYLARIRDQPPGTLPRLVRFAARPSLARAVGPVIDASRRAQGLVRAASSARGHRLTWSAGADSRVDALWEAARDEYPIVGVRTSAFLSWRYPGASFAWLAARGGGERAYAIIEIDATTRAAHIRDLFGHHGSFSPLLSLLLVSLREKGAASVSVNLLGSPRLRESLARCGFVSRPERGIVVVQAGDGAPKGLDPGNPDLWHLLDADEDA